MIRATHGSTVTVSYIGTLENGRIFDSTQELGPLTFCIGSDQVFPALEQAIIGMAAGETRNIVLSADQAYGPRLKENIIKLSRGVFPAERDITAGQKLSIDFRSGGSRVMLVTEVTASEVTLDGNHPLAGCELTFAIRLDGIE